MQRMTTMPTRHWRGSGALLIAAIVALLVLLFLLVMNNVSTTPQSTPVAPALPTTSTRPYNRFFADEANYRPTVEEYLNPYMTETYLPITPPEAVQPATQEVNRFFADEMAGAGQAPIIIDLVTSPPERATPQFGPR